MKEGHVPPRSDSRERRIGGRAQDDHIDDPYARTEKPADPSVCRQCGAVFGEGRWHWGAPPAHAAEVLCSACRRTNDRYPAGIVTLKGDYLLDPRHRQEILNIARHQEELEKSEHPLNRIMSIEERDGEIVIATTDIHLPRRIGEVVHRAHHGDFDVRYDEDAYFIRVDWQRNGSGS